MANSIASVIQKIEQTVGGVVIDQPAAIRSTLLAIACGGHTLIEDIPGVGKTTLARSIAQVLGLEFQRIQGTTDKLPAEITGSSVWDAKAGEFRFVAGPIFAQCVLVDEINRMPPKSQSALLEAMEEGQVTIDTVTHGLPRPFIVLATQNPIELEGTFPLPEAALDRFFIRIRMGYPSTEGEKRLHRQWTAPAWRTSPDAHNPALPQILAPKDIFTLRHKVAEIHVSDEAEDYLMTLLQATRQHPEVRLGLSPRAGLALRQAAQAWAAFAGREHVKPDDFQEVLTAIGAHRLILYPEADLRGKTTAAVLREVVEQTAVPGSWAALSAGKGR